MRDISKVRLVKGLKIILYKNWKVSKMFSLENESKGESYDRCLKDI